MCDPVTAGLVALQGVQSVSAISAQNDAAMSNARAAKLAANDKYASSTERYIEDNRSLIQGGFDAVLAGREAEADAYTSAIQNGVQGASVKATLRDKKRTTARSAGRTSQEMEGLQRNATATFTNIRAQTAGRIASVPTTSFGLGDAAKMLTPIVRSQME